VVGEAFGRAGFQRDGLAHQSQACGGVVAAQEQNLGAVQGTGDGADECFGGVSAADLGPAAHARPVAARQAFDHHPFDAWQRRSTHAALGIARMHNLALAG
jgi:asparagine synthetase B (glutamine-hydrolysing)